VVSRMAAARPSMMVVVVNAIQVAPSM